MWFAINLLMLLYSSIIVLRGILSACSSSPPSSWPDTRSEDWARHRRFSAAEAVIFTLLAALFASEIVNEVQKWRLTD